MIDGARHDRGRAPCCGQPRSTRHGLREGVTPPSGYRRVAPCSCLIFRSASASSADEMSVARVRSSTSFAVLISSDVSQCTERSTPPARMRPSYRFASYSGRPSPTSAPMSPPAVRASRPPRRPPPLPSSCLPAPSGASRARTPWCSGRLRAADRACTRRDQRTKGTSSHRYDTSSDLWILLGVTIIRRRTN